MDLQSADQTTRLAIGRLLEDPIFEVIPLSNVLDEVDALPDGARVSVTASPNKTLDDTLDLAAELASRGFRATPHLSARMTKDMAHVEHLLKRIADLDITSVFIVGGDAEFDGEFFDGHALIQAMESVGHDLAIGIPAYPEGHPDIPASALVDALGDKQEHATWMATQMCFDGAALEGWLREMRRVGIDLPIVLGLPGVADRMKLLRISTRIGVGRSLSFLRKNTGLISKFVNPAGYDPAEFLLDIGDYLSDETANITGLHIYTFNACRLTSEWRTNLLAELSEAP